MRRRALERTFVRRGDSNPPEPATLASSSTGGEFFKDADAESTAYSEL